MNSNIKMDTISGNSNPTPLFGSSTAINSLGGAMYPYGSGGIGMGSTGYTYNNPITYYDTNMFSIKLRPVENGWILVKDNKEYVLHTAEEIVKYLETSKT